MREPLITDEAVCAAQEASLRSMASLFARMDTPIGHAIAGDLKFTADRMKWAGARLDGPAEGDA